MPLRVAYKNHQEKSLQIWHITESESFFRARTEINAKKWEEVSTWVPSRRLEWLAGRYLIHRYANCSSKNLIIDQFGKPQIPEHGEISISHSGAYAAIYIDDVPCGVDIQVTKKSILRIQHKFCNPEDLEIFSDYDLMDALHLIWCSKEAVYKAYGQKEVDYRQHIHIIRSGNRLIAQMTKLPTPITYELELENFGDLYIASCRLISGE